MRMLSFMNCYPCWSRTGVRMRRLLPRNKRLEIAEILVTSSLLVPSDPSSVPYDHLSLILSPSIEALTGETLIIIS